MREPQVERKMDPCEARFEYDACTPRSRRFAANADQRRLFGVSVSLLLALAIAYAAPPARAAGDPLPSWNEGAAKKSILEFVTAATREGGPGFIAPAERIAVFDNDGTLWVEKPLYVQLVFAIDRVKALAPQHPEWKTKEPFASLLTGDPEKVLAAGARGTMEV